jgi:hypothetical protein
VENRILSMSQEDWEKGHKIVSNTVKMKTDGKHYLMIYFKILKDNLQPPPGTKFYKFGGLFSSELNVSYDKNGNVEVFDRMFSTYLKASINTTDLRKAFNSLFDDLKICLSPDKRKELCPEVMYDKIISGGWVPEGRLNYPRSYVCIHPTTCRYYRFMDKVMIRKPLRIRKCCSSIWMMINPIRSLV